MQETKRRILLMYITKVSGHRQATVAIYRALKSMDPSVDVPIINGFGYTYPILEKVVNQAYMSVIKRTPKVWDVMYDNPKIVKNSSSLKNFLHKTSHKKISKLFARYKPETVVCTQAFPCGMVADYKRAYNVPVTLIGVLTDFEPHSFWVNEGVDCYVVPTLEAKERMVAMGVNPDIIKIYGIPIKSKFSVQLDKRPIQQRYGLNPKKPTILVMGGGQGLGPIKSIVKSLIKMDMDVQAIVLAGKNEKIVTSLRKTASKCEKKIMICEYVNNVDELMEVSSLIISKPGGITTAESLAKGLPMVIVDPIPGQETRNTDFLIKQGVGIRIDDTRDIGEEISLILRTPERLASMRRSALAKARPHASLDIARLILQKGD